MKTESQGWHVQPGWTRLHYVRVGEGTSVCGTPINRGAVLVTESEPYSLCPTCRANWMVADE